MKERYFVEAHANKVDPECMFNKYKQYNLQAKIPENIKVTADLIEIHDVDMLIFSDIVILCSLNNQPILEYTFEYLMTYQVLLKSYYRDSEYPTYDLFCFAEYANENGFFKGLNDKFITKLTKNEDMNCEDYITEPNKELHDIFHSDRSFNPTEDCLEVLPGIENFILRTYLLLHVDLKHYQRQVERKQFVEDMRVFMKNLLLCMM